MTFRERLVKRASKAGLILPVPVAEQLQQYFELLQKWNQKLALTSLPIQDAQDEALDRILIEPLVAAKALPAPDAHLVDVGSGGGSPAIPLKICADRVSLRMVESKTRKAAFLREVVRALKLTSTSVDSVRVAELLAQRTLHEAADAITLRGVRPDKKLLSQLDFLLKPGGLLLFFSAETTPGIDVLPALGFRKTARYRLLPHLGSYLDVWQKSLSLPKD